MVVDRPPSACSMIVCPERNNEESQHLQGDISRSGSSRGARPPHGTGGCTEQAQGLCTRPIDVLQFDAFVATELRNLQEKARQAPRGLSPDEAEDVSGEKRNIVFWFMKTDGLLRKTGPKSEVVQTLEKKHCELIHHYRQMVDLQISLRHIKRVPMTVVEKERLILDIQNLPFYEMKAALEIIAYGSNRFELLQMNEVEIDLAKIDNSVLREVQMYIKNKEVLRIEEIMYAAEKDIERFEAYIILLQYFPDDTNSAMVD